MYSKCRMLYDTKDVMKNTIKNIMVVTVWFKSKGKLSARSYSILYVEMEINVCD